MAVLLQGLDHLFSVYRSTITFKRTRAVRGNYDLIVQVEAENMEALSDLLMSKIRAVDGVIKTNTCIVLNV
jgi:DNA-binding Lrp family transcriptional regulator